MFRGIFSSDANEDLLSSWMFIQATDRISMSRLGIKFLGCIQARHVIDIVVNDNPHSVLFRVVLGNFLLRNSPRHFLFTKCDLRLKQSARQRRFLLRTVCASSDGEQGRNIDVFIRRSRSEIRLRRLVTPPSSRDPSSDSTLD